MELTVEEGAQTQPPPQPPPTEYRLLRPDETAQEGDMAWNALAEAWEPIMGMTHLIQQLTGAPWRYTPARKEQ